MLVCGRQGATPCLTGFSTLGLWSAPRQACVHSMAPVIGEYPGGAEALQGRPRWDKIQALEPRPPQAPPHLLVPAAFDPATLRASWQPTAHSPCWLLPRAFAPAAPLPGRAFCSWPLQLSCQVWRKPHVLRGPERARTCANVPPATLHCTPLGVGLFSCRIGWLASVDPKGPQFRQEPGLLGWTLTLTSVLGALSPRGRSRWGAWRGGLRGGLSGGKHRGDMTGNAQPRIVLGGSSTDRTPEWPRGPHSPGGTGW